MLLHVEFAKNYYKKQQFKGHISEVLDLAFLRHVAMQKKRRGKKA